MTYFNICGDVSKADNTDTIEVILQFNRDGFNFYFITNFTPHNSGGPFYPQTFKPRSIL